MSIFSKIQLTRPKTSTFNLSHDRKFSMNMGDLVPMLVEECVPGDKFNIKTSQMLRMMPMISPVMHEVNVFTHFFFVPNRLLWNNWEKFITGGENGLDTTLFPTALYGDIPNPVDKKAGSLLDHLGLPIVPSGDPSSFSNIKFNLLPFAAYNLIYDEYYRDQNLITPVSKDLADGHNSTFPTGYFSIKKRAWQHDYFTSALPWAQKGAPVRLPLGTSAPIRYKDGQIIPDNVETVGGTFNQSTDGFGIKVPGKALRVKDASGSWVNASIDNSDMLEADLSEATSATVNDLRRAFKLQEWLEKNARAGSRYIESILSHFGVRSSDSRLQRPEYLGGGMSPVMISEVLQTSETQSTALGEMAGHGLNLGGNGFVNKFCEEHGFIIGIVSVMPKTAYQQGLPRMYSKFDKFDYFWPEFEHIGEQSVLSKELYATGELADDNVFGYIPRYAEYKYNPSTVHGYFKTSLDFWHMGRKFNNRPVLNSTFVESNPTKRIFAVEDESEDVLLVHMFHNISARRLMSYYSDPSFR